MKLSSSIITLLFLINSGITFSQNTSVDKMFEEARTLAFSNRSTEARKLCYRILEQKNNYYDARILLARTFSWDHKFDSARYHLQTVLRQEPYVADAYLAYADVEMWSNNCPKAAALCDSALIKIPNNYDILIKKANACLCTENVLCARATIDTLLKGYSPNIEIQNLLKRAREGNFRNRLIVEHSFEYFKHPYNRRWHVTSFQYQRDAKWGTYMAKVNAGQLIPASGELFNPGAVQYEVDAYPLLGKGYYAYLNYGYSDGELFPKHRGGLELFKTFPRGTEISLGARDLYFNDVENILIFTGSVSKYVASWWFSFRPYFSVIDDELQQSYFVFARKYSSQYNYVGAMLGYGISPDYLPATSGYELYNLNSYQARIDIQHRLSKHFLFRALTGYAYDQYTSNNYRHRFNLQLYLGYMF